MPLNNNDIEFIYNNYFKRLFFIANNQIGSNIFISGEDLSNDVFMELLEKKNDFDCKEQAIAWIQKRILRKSSDENIRQKKEKKMIQDLIHIVKGKEIDSSSGIY